ncbi:CUE domain-containing protein 2 [Geodia barretti]|uniref:CUE domain-containing protein 2 n=1 Tax=Geodia barretti TaxID=519541 RepID=A0AA35RMB5_GEOBA|nr:CUE domain-containing protein 2 [Geodia barretti]
MESISFRSSVVCQWVFELAEKQKAVKPRMEDSRSQKPAAPKTEQTSKAKLRTKTRGGNGEKSTEGTTSTNDTATGDGGEVSLLREMFPSVGEETISAVLMKCQGDMEEAIQQLLALPEEITRGREMEVKTRGQTRHLGDPSRTEVCGDKDIKESLLARYSFVDTKEDKVTHRPVLSKPLEKTAANFILIPGAKKDGEV